MAELDELEYRLDALLANVAPAERVRLAHQLGRELRRSFARRIRSNVAPDGSAFEPRKERAPLRSKAGRIKRRKAAGAMFRKMGRPDALDWEASADGVSVGFAGAALQRIARVHQLGLRDRVARAQGAPEAQYPARRLLGLSDGDRRRILDLVLQRLASV
jgi:phage virion morphogenesis protein